MMKRLLPLLVSILTAGVALAPAASAYDPEESAIFNDVQRDFATRWELMHHVQKTIDSVPRDGEILISTFLLDRRVVVDKLITAAKRPTAGGRNVSVRVIMDDEIVNSEADRLQNALNADNPSGTVTSDPATWGRDRSYAKKCVGSCRGAGGNMHTKFYAFSQAGTVHDIVMVSSANLNAGGALKGYNDLFTMTEQAATYDFYSTIHDEMTDDTRGDFDRYRVFEDPDGVFESRFFPMRTATIDTDPVMVDLSKVNCNGAAAGYGDGNGHTTIHVSMFYWDGERGIWIRDKLLQLAENGCKVNIVYGAPSATVAPRLKNRAEAGLITLFDSRVHTDDDGLVDVRVHSKYMLISGNFGGNPAEKVVFTGSQNWVGGSLTRGDEVLLAIDDNATYNQYLENWDLVTDCPRSRPIPGDPCS